MAAYSNDIGPDAPPPYVDPVTEHRGRLAEMVSQLPEMIRQTRSEHRSRRDEQDLHHLACLVPEVEAFLARVATLPQQTRRLRSELVLVVAEAVPAAWTLSGIEEQIKEGDVVQVVRVACAADDKSDPKTSSTSSAAQTSDGRGSAEFDEWGRWREPSSSQQPMGVDASSSAASGGWWCDGGMARRLAARLLPGKVENQEQKTEQSQKKKGSWRPWATTRNEQAPTVRPAVSITTEAEELTFRRQNEMGIYESMTGWGVVLRVTSCV